LVFAASQSGVLAAIDGRTGDRVWQQPIGTTQAPALAGESKGELIAFDPQTGDEIDRLKLGDPVYIEPIAVQDKLIVLTDDARLIAIR